MHYQPADEKVEKDTGTTRKDYTNKIIAKLKPFEKFIMEREYSCENNKRLRCGLILFDLENLEFKAFVDRLTISGREPSLYCSETTYKIKTEKKEARETE